MYEFSRILGKLVRKTRTQMGLTQMDVSSALEMDNRTILNIENYRGNPKLCVVSPVSLLKNRRKRTFLSGIPG